jgi:inosine triphosphate pyrophosphatase
MNSKFVIITGNKHKLAEFKRLIPDTITFDNLSIDLAEIQSLDSNKIVEHKVREAYKLINKPVIVEDVSAGLDSLKGLPGPFIKFFEERLGRDALYQLAGENKEASVTCTIGYYDGTDLFICQGEIKGSVKPIETDKGFGFDAVFVPNGHKLSFAEMGTHQKDKISHRAIAVAKLVDHLS